MKPSQDSIAHVDARLTILITGATDGIGRRAALELAARDVDLVVHGRNPAKLQRLVTELDSLGPGAVSMVAADFADLDSIPAMVDALSSTLDGPLDVLINNAGVYMTERRDGRQGFEMTFTVNYLAPVLLSHLVLPLLRPSAHARIINVASIAHARGELHWGDFNLVDNFVPDRAYAQAKLALVMITTELARRLGSEGILCVSMHPGIVATKLLEARGIPALNSMDESARGLLHLAMLPADSLRPAQGKYFIGRRQTPVADKAQDAAVAGRLYRQTCEWLGLEGLG